MTKNSFVAKRNMLPVSKIFLNQICKIDLTKSILVHCPSCFFKISRSSKRFSFNLGKP